MHFQQNLGCETTVFVASFDFVDPGTLQIAQNLFSLDQGVVNATLGDIGVDIFENLNLPANVVLGTLALLRFLTLFLRRVLQVHRVAWTAAVSIAQRSTSREQGFSHQPDLSLICLAAPLLLTTSLSPTPPGLSPPRCPLLLSLPLRLSQTLPRLTSPRMTRSISHSDRTPWALLSSD
jgi:hypothetical protein